MGKISEFRLININYNNGGIRINDEIFHMNEKDTLLSLRNGGGKSVLVQMLTAPFVHKAFRRSKDRTFEGYFTSTKPSFILIEWSLGGNNRMMNGFMLRRRPEETFDSGEEREVLDILGIISEYREACPWDIHNLPVVERNRREITLKSFASCRQLFEGFRKEKGARFFMYDMGQSAQQRQYFTKLREYKVDYREWENVIKKVNQKEGGLADLFADCRDERGLVDKWFLDAVEKKLDPDGSKIRGFGNIIKMHSVQCYENEDKIKRREDILEFRKCVAPGSEEEGGQGVKNAALELKKKDDEIRHQEDRILSFLLEIKTLAEKTSASIDVKQSEAEENSSRIDRLWYEKYSGEIHSLLKAGEEMKGNLVITALELDELKKKLENGERTLRKLEMKKAFDERQEEYGIREKLKSDLNAARLEDEELEPRRRELGSILYSYYSDAAAATGKRISDSEENLKKLQEEEKTSLGSIDELDRDKEEILTKIGRLQGNIDSFEREEDDWHRTYGTALVRNILGRYEEGALTLEKERITGEIREAENGRKKAKEKRQAEELRGKKLESDLNGERINRNDLSHREDSLNREKEELERQEVERRDIVSYVELPERDLYDREGILKAFDGKIEIIEADIRSLQEEETSLRRTISALESGKIVNMPAQIEEGLKRKGLDPTFGMEWLRKNGRSLKENLGLVRENPFLPYALIFTEKEIERFKAEEPDFYTEIPLPVIKRGDLEKGLVREDNRRGGYVELEDIGFVLRFNEDYLDEEKLASIIGGQRIEAEELRKKTELRRQEREEYIKRREIIRGQTLTEERLRDNEEAIKTVRDEIEASEKRTGALEAEKEESSLNLDRLQREIEELDSAVVFLTEQLRRLAALSESYERYLDTLEKRERLEKDVSRITERKKLIRDRIDRIREDAEKERLLSESLRRSYSEQDKKLRIFISYETQEKPEADLDDDQRDSMEAEYLSLTQKYSGEMMQLEKELQEQENRLKKADRELNRFEKKYGLSTEDLTDIIYSEEEYDRQAERIKSIEAKTILKKEQYHREDKEISVRKAQVEERLKRMEEETGHKDILPPEEIPDKDPLETINILKQRMRAIEEEERRLEARLRSFREVINSLDEYEGMTPVERIGSEEDFSAMNIEELNEFRGILRRDLKHLTDERQKKRAVLYELINDLIMLPRFRDDYYRKPLEAMLRETDTPENVLKQIDVTLRSFEELMEKIAIDLSIIEDERKTIQNELGDYIRDIHSELGKIDSNSTIPVRNRNIKMLSIRIPSWLDNEELYRIRVRDYVEQVVKNCMELCRNNENPDEYTGTQVNTRELYDTVVGISNVQVQLYKIEKQREYPISWAEVSKNSGGEGFLSSFVILSSLLHYMRRDDNELFADKNEGKVLLMDNPFGVTYSEHLLKPLMELAKKNNTQLICFSGLGGDSIYGRFDNIYVLNLVEAGLKSGMLYLKPEHRRGNDPEVIVPSQVEVIKQLTLF